jgi:hypothetical protein
MAPANSLPRWLGPASRLNLLVLRLGLRIGTQHILSVPGRKTGRMRSTPVSLVLTGVRERHGIRSVNEEARHPCRVVGG